MNVAMDLNLSPAENITGTQRQERALKTYIPCSSHPFFNSPTCFLARSPCIQCLTHFPSVSLCKLISHCFFMEARSPSCEKYISLEQRETREDVFVSLSQAKVGSLIKLWSRQASRQWVNIREVSIAGRQLLFFEKNSLKVPKM